MSPKFFPCAEMPVAETSAFRSRKRTCGVARLYLRGTRGRDVQHTAQTRPQPLDIADANEIQRSLLILNLRSPEPTSR